MPAAKINTGMEFTEIEDNNYSPRQIHRMLRALHEDRLSLNGDKSRIALQALINKGNMWDSKNTSFFVSVFKKIVEKFPNNKGDFNQIWDNFISLQEEGVIEEQQDEVLSRVERLLSGGIEYSNSGNLRGVDARPYQ